MFMAALFVVIKDCKRCQVSFKECMVKQRYHEILLSITKEKQILIRTLTWIKLKECMLSGKSQSQNSYCDSIYITRVKQHNYREGKFISGCWSLGIGNECGCGYKGVV